MQRNFSSNNLLVAVVLDHPVLVSFVFHATALIASWRKGYLKDIVVVV